MKGLYAKKLENFVKIFSTHEIHFLVQLLVNQNSNYTVHFVYKSSLSQTARIWGDLEEVKWEIKQKSSYYGEQKSDPNKKTDYERKVQWEKNLVEWRK